MPDRSSKITKLPVWRTAKAAYLVIFHNPQLAMKLGIIPLAFVIFPAILQGYLWGGMTMTEMSAAMTDNTGLFILLSVVGWVSYLATIPMITAWHRMVIRGHADPDSRIRYSIGRNEGSYLWKVFLFGLLIILIYIFAVLVSFLPAIFISAFASQATQDTSFATIITMLVSASVLFIVFGFVLRLSLVFPAAAVGKPIGFRKSWRESRGNTWRLFAAVCLGFLPSLVMPVVVNGLLFNFWVFDVANATMPTMLVQVLMSAINIPFWLIGLCVGVSVWSWAYRYLVQGYPITLPGDEPSTATAI